MSRQVVAPRYGGPEVLELRDREIAPPGTGRVLIRVLAAGVNPADTKRIAGRFGDDPSKLPLRPGSEVAGIVTAVGEDVAPAGRGIEVGQEVVAYPVVGGWADEVVAKAEHVFPKPGPLSFPAAANLLLAGTAAAHLVDVTGVGTGDVVLVHGASGGVGTLAVQLARLAGARVLGTTSDRNADLVRRLGAEPVRYGDGLVDRVRALAPGGVDAALDCVGTDEAVRASLALLADPGRLATIVAFEAVLAAGGKALGAGPGADPGTAFRNAARAGLIALADEGRLEVPVAATRPLAEASEALRVLARDHPGGKLALVP
ncbi:NADP-dependent oxidoreductase [Amnibacterium sp.]|uniref:NADP-dependent oxidoreductase n=1 Tax=Amnibacterium sp. TaxID=1872496 RepID=UPI00261C0EE8|nr:NADP-dependent oxidoreductase [Amnibacterium sp.]MCU1471990.1 Alcohol dehydrogenase zinc-binding domain protein [Amnibacterium sp.]